MSAIARAVTGFLAAGGLVASIPVAAEPFLNIPAIRFIQGTGKDSVKPLAWHIPKFAEYGLPVDNTYPPLTEKNRTAAKGVAETFLPKGTRWPKTMPMLWRNVTHTTHAESVSAEDVAAIVADCGSVDIYPMGPHGADPSKEDALATYQCAKTDGDWFVIQAGMVVNNGQVEELFIGYQTKIMVDLAGKVPVN